MTKNIEQTQAKAYASIIFVVLYWGIAPVIINEVLKYFSASLYSALYSTFSALFLVIICRKSLRQLGSKYLKVAVPTGLFLSVAELLQKIGLPYTTPANYAFLENLTCVAVPVLMYCLTRKKPSGLTVFSSALCFVSVFIISGINVFEFHIGIGDLLCATAGVLFSFNIVGTGVFAKDLKASLYIFVQMCVASLFNWALVLSDLFIGGASAAISLELPLIPTLVVAGNALIAGVLCWILRTKAMQKISPTAVAVIMPFSAVITCITSVIVGIDSLTVNLVVGGILCLTAALLSGLASARDAKR